VKLNKYQLSYIANQIPHTSLTKESHLTLKSHLWFISQQLYLKHKHFQICCTDSVQIAVHDQETKEHTQNIEPQHEFKNVKLDSGDRIAQSA